MKVQKKVSNGKQSLWLAIGRILALFFAMSIPLFLTRILEKDEYGFYSQFNTIIYFLSSFFSFGMYHNLFYFYPNANYNEKKSIVIQTFIFLLFASILSVIVIFIPEINSFFMGDGLLLSYKIVIFILTIVLALTSIMQPLYIVNKDLRISLWFPPLQIILKVVFIFIFFAIIPSINSLVVAILVSSILTLFIIVLYITKTIKKFPHTPIFNRKIAKEQLQYSIPMVFASGLHSISQKFDKIISISFLSATSYASYSIAFFGIPGIQQIYESISQVAIVDIAKKINVGEKSKALDIYKKMVTKTLSFSVPIILIVALNAEHIIIVLFTEKYRDAIPLFQLYLLSFIFVMLGSGIVLRASGNTKDIRNAFFYASVISIPLTYYSVKYYGSFGAIFGALVSIILPKLFQMKKEISIMETRLFYFLPWYKIIQIFVISFVVIIPCFLIEKKYTENNMFIIVLISIAYLVVVSLIEIKLNIFIIDKSSINLYKKKFYRFWKSI